jgi:hypothetical protein
MNVAAQDRVGLKDNDEVLSKRRHDDFAPPFFQRRA